MTSNLDTQSQHLGIRQHLIRMKDSLRIAFKNPSFLSGFIILLIVCVIAFFPEWFTIYDPVAISVGDPLIPPSAEHLFGTDNFGRDVFARVIFATQIDLQLAVLSTIVPFVVGSLLGLVAGYYGKKIDMIIMRILDVLMAFPFTVLVISIITILGNGLQNIYIAIWLVGWIAFARLVRAEVLRVKEEEFIQAARVAGFSDLRIIFRHVLPNAISPAVVYATSYAVLCMLTAAGMSFLGLGVQPPTPEWGALLSEGRSFIGVAWWMTLFPGIFMAVTGIGFSLLGDGLTDFIRAKGR